jgi:hypothetical protein
MAGFQVSIYGRFWVSTEGYQTSQAIFVAVKLGIADLLKDAPKSSDDLAASAGVNAQALTHGPRQRRRPSRGRTQILCAHTDGCSRRPIVISQIGAS